MSKFRPRPAHFEHKSQIAPNSLVFHPKMSDATKLLLLALNGIASCAPNWTVVQCDLQNRMGWGRAKMQSAIREAVYLGYLLVTQTRQTESKKDKNGKYIKGQFSKNEFEFDINGGYPTGVNFKPSTVDHLPDPSCENDPTSGFEPRSGLSPTALSPPENQPLPCYEFNLVKEQTKQEQKENCSVVVVLSQEQKEIIKILEPYALQEEILQSFLSLPLNHLSESVVAYEQYLKSETNKGKKVDNPIGALRRAILCKWKPNLTKVDKEEQKELKDHEISMLIFHNRTDANNAYNKYKEKFNENFSFHVNENAVTLKYKKGYSALALNDPDFSNILEYYIKAATKE